MPEQLHKLVNDYSARNTLDIDAENRLIGSDIRGMSHLTRCFEVYCRIVLELAPESVYGDLNKAFAMYWCHLNALLANYTFDSVLAFHKTLMYARINGIQDDPRGGESLTNVWRTATSSGAIQTLATTSLGAPKPTSPPRERCRTAIAGALIMTSNARAVPISTMRRMSVT